MTDIELIRLLTGNDEISDTFIAFYLNMTEKFILTYCNIEKIPEALKPTLLEITALRVKANSSGGKTDLGAGIKKVSSITDGSQSISYQNSGTAVQISTDDDILATYGNVLNRYRKMVIERPVKRPLGARHINSKNDWS